MNFNVFCPADPVPRLHQWEIPQLCYQCNSMFFLGRLCDSNDEIFFSAFDFPACFVQYEGKGLQKGHGTPSFNLGRNWSCFQARNMKKNKCIYGYKILAIKL